MKEDYMPTISQTLVEAQELRDSKAQDYQNSTIVQDYFPFGLISYVQMLWVKALRLKSLASKSGAANAVYEPIRDTLLDLINYATFAIEYLDSLSKED